MTPSPVFYPFEVRIYEYVEVSKDPRHEQRVEKCKSIISKFLRDMDNYKNSSSGVLDDDYVDLWVRSNIKRKISVRVFSTR